MPSFSDWELVCDDGSVHPVVVPGTVSQAVRALDADARTWVFRTTVSEVPDGPVDLVVDGVATSYAVVVDGTVVLTGRSMHARHRVPVSVRVGSTVEVQCFPLTTALPEPRPGRARWRTRLVDDNDLRLVRTTLMGRAPGFAPGPPVVGPYRDIRLEPHRVPLRFRTSMEGTTGVLEVSDPSVLVTCAGVSGHGTVRVPAVVRWWPHTHGDPVLHDVTVDGRVVARVGFRTVERSEPFGLVVNGIPVWARGAVWTPPGLLAGVPEDPLDTVQTAVEAGMNLLRVPGWAPYESDRFFRVCDALGVLVWHDLALANLDVPHDLLGLDNELDTLLAQPGPSLAVVCGGSETAQQVAMLGLDPDLWRSDFLDRRAPSAVGDRAVWVANAPEALRSHGVAHWFGVGGYRQPLSAARTHAPAFAAECLAFSVGEGEPPRDNGATWDFGDVTRHYAPLTPGQVMARVLGEWRRPQSPNAGAVVLSLRDVVAGAGWGLLDVDGRPKDALAEVAPVLAPRALWLVDEGLDGVAVHLANDRPTPWTGTLELDLGAHGTASTEVTVPAHGHWTGDVEQLLGRWVDVSWAYRFGERSVDVVTATFSGKRASLHLG